MEFHEISKQKIKTDKNPKRRGRSNRISTYRKMSLWPQRSAQYMARDIETLHAENRKAFIVIIQSFWLVFVALKFVDGWCHVHIRISVRVANTENSLDANEWDQNKLLMSCPKKFKITKYLHYIELTIDRKKFTLSLTWLDRSSKPHKQHSILAKINIIWCINGVMINT